MGKCKNTTQQNTTSVGQFLDIIMQKLLLMLPFLMTDVWSGVLISCCHISDDGILKEKAFEPAEISTEGVNCSVWFSVGLGL